MNREPLKKTPGKRIKINQHALEGTMMDMLEIHDSLLKRFKFHPMVESLSHIAGEFFWLPTFKMFNDAGLIDEKLQPSKIMLENNFAASSFAVIGDDGKTEEEFLISSMGLDFLHTLIREFSWDNPQLAPDPSFVPKANLG